MAMSRVALFGFLLLALLSFSGCSTTAGLEARGKTGWDDEGKRILEKRVTYESGSLKGDLEIVDLKSGMVNDIMRAQATLRSRDRDTLPFEYRFEWFDTNGFEVGTKEAWKPIILYGKETRNIQTTAPDPRAREFVLKLREPQK
ncbi:MAG: hypothetical protein Fur0034_00250 [Desulfuromonadia bacterium]